MQTFKHKVITALSQSATLYGYIPDNSEEIAPERTRPTVLICPGGGYVMTSDREAEPVAIQLLARGFNVLILRYSVAPARYPVALVEAAEAMRQIRLNAQAWHVDPEKIIIAGFSAGGHLAADLAVQWNRDLVSDYGFNAAEIKPNGLFLAYSVITSGEYAHQGSFEALLGDKYGQADLMRKVSLETQVTKNTPKTFMWHTETDDTVPVENSLFFAEALRRAKVSFEMHIFPQGGHGLSLGTSETAISNGYGLQPEITVWPDLFATWVKYNF